MIFEMQSYILRICKITSAGIYLVYFTEMYAHKMCLLIDAREKEKKTQRVGEFKKIEEY